MPLQRQVFHRDILRHAQAQDRLRGSEHRRLGDDAGCFLRNATCRKNRFKDNEGCEEAEDDEKESGLIHEVTEDYRQREERLDTQQEEEAHGSGKASWAVFRHHLEVPWLASVYNYCTYRDK